MTSPYQNSPPSPFPLELNLDQHHQLLISATPQVSSSSSSFSNPIFFNPAQDQGRRYYMALNHFQNDQEVDKLVAHGGSSCDHISLKNESDSENKFSFWNKESKIEDQSETFSVKWMPSKMRMMRKMINSEQTGHADIPLNSMKKFEDQKQSMAPAKTDNSSNNSFNNNNPTVRVCADCNTTKTPLWRSGPRGPKSLCNACGIRQRKARRAMAAAAAAANGTTLATNPPSMKSTKVQHKDKRASKSYVPKFKKKCKLNTPDHGRKKVCFEDFAISLSKNSAFQRVFPQDEKEAAILLMALSYGLVHG